MFFPAFAEPWVNPSGSSPFSGSTNTSEMGVLNRLADGLGPFMPCLTPLHDRLKSCSEKHPRLLKARWRVTKIVAHQDAT